MMGKTQQYSFQTKVHAFLQVSRANLLLTSIGHATLGMLLAAGSISNLFRLEAVLYVLLHYNVAFFGCHVNSYFDYDVDILYKRYMADGVDIIGRSTLMLLIFIEGISALFLIMVFYSLGYVIVAMLDLIDLLGAFLYSAEQVRIKKQGLISPIPVLILYSFPLLGGWFVFQHEIRWVFIVFVLGYLFMNEGFTLVNTCEDYTEDKKTGIITWAHIFGLKKTLKLAFLFSLGGFFCIISLVIFRVESDIMISFSMILSVIMMVVSVVLIGKASLEVREVYIKGSRQGFERQAKVYGRRLQRWFMMTRYPLIISAFLLLW
jgi:4-hydroxybenzoate polyprenyltransferase